MICLLFIVMGFGAGLVFGAWFIHETRNWGRTFIGDGRNHAVQVLTVEGHARVYVDGHLEP